MATTVNSSSVTGVDYSIQVSRNRLLNEKIIRVCVSILQLVINSSASGTNTLAPCARVVLHNEQSSTGTPAVTLELTADELHTFIDQLIAIRNSIHN